MLPSSLIVVVSVYMLEAFGLIIMLSAQVGAAREPNIFPSPDEVRLDRPLDSYIHYGEGPHTCLGRDANMVALTSMLRVVGRLENLRRAPGPQGELKKIARPGGFYMYMREDHDSYFVFPMSKSCPLAHRSVEMCKGLTWYLFLICSDESAFRRRASSATDEVI